MKNPDDVYLGRNEGGEHVFARVRIEDADLSQTVMFTDHTEGPRPAEIAISFVLITASRRPHADRGRTLDRFSDERWVSGGQLDPDDRMILNAPDAVRVIERAWATSHLNLMNAACDHMTARMLDGMTQDQRLDNVVCPVTGYHYGRAWLARKVDESLIQELRDAVATLGSKVR